MNLLRVEDLSVSYVTERGELKALSEVFLELSEGEILGVLGESGSGKSTLAYSVLRMLPPNAKIIKGKVIFEGKDLLRLSEEELSKIRGKRLTLIPQNSMNALSPVHKIGDQLADVLVKHEGLSKREALKVVKEKLRIAKLSEDVTNRYFHELSGGMRQRVMTAMSLLTDPKLIIADEPTTGLDVIVQYQLLRELKSLQRKLGFSMMIISHDVSVIAKISDFVMVLYGGRVLECGDVISVFKGPKSPYTQLLLASFPDISSPVEKITEIPGSPPDLIEPPEGCIFHPRCPYATEACRRKEPPLVRVGEGHYARCHLL